MSKVALKIDQQVGFTTGALRNPAAIQKLPYLAEKARRQAAEGYVFYCTLDTHADTEAGYMTSQEGKHLPVYHCGAGSEDHRLAPEVRSIYEELGAVMIEKYTFGSKELVEALLALDKKDPIQRIEADGFVTEICVISNLLLLKAYFPEVELVVDAAGCAGITPEGHQAALLVAKACQIEVIGDIFPSPAPGR